MSRPVSVILAGAAFALYAGLGVAAYAQPAPPKPPPGADRETRTIVIRRGDERRDSAEHLRAILQLRPNQEAALQAYVEATRAERPRLERLTGEGDGRTTPERLARMEARLAEQQARARAVIDATRRFYDQLDAGQKRAFDEMPLMMLPGGQVQLLPISASHIRAEVMKGLEGLDRLHDLDAFGEPPEPPRPPTPPAPPRL